MGFLDVEPSPALRFLYEQYKQIESSYNHFATHCKLTYSESGSLVDFNRCAGNLLDPLLVYVSFLISLVLWFPNFSLKMKGSHTFNG